jgi:hypothetical protein
MEGHAWRYQGHVELFSAYPSELIERAFRVPRRQQTGTGLLCPGGLGITGAQGRGRSHGGVPCLVGRDEGMGLPHVG